MVNFIEKRLPKTLRENIRTLIAAGLGLFLGLQYNEYIRKLVDRFVPDTGNLFIEGVILIGLTVVIVYASLALQKALDGK